MLVDVGEELVADAAELLGSSAAAPGFITAAAAVLFQAVAQQHGFLRQVPVLLST